MSSTIDDLAELLNEIKPPLRISPGEASRSIIHDISYRLAVIFLVFEILGKKKPNGTSEINATLLWFCQFLVARPDLLPNFLQWAMKERKKTAIGSLFGWPLLPKGYLNDNEHLRLLSILIATNSVDVRDTDTAILKQNVDASLKDLQVYINQPETFKREKLVLQKLKETDVTLKLLGVG